MELPNTASAFGRVDVAALATAVAAGTSDDTPGHPAATHDGRRTLQIHSPSHSLSRGRGRGDCMQPRPEIRTETPRAPLRTESSRRMLEIN